ncbi:MAG TPA: Holliday junction branch migration protein RuvA [Candidatus Bipolaricaulota bacterium]|nr:Holliday junction branch migration protein RuvA [Candidatus Bipolaricaulota bacterium]
MLSFIKGTIKNKGENFVILARNDLGYKIFTNKKLLAELSIGDAAEFYLYENIREDADDLFGFSSFEELGLFEKLISVNGVGPKTALNVFAAYSVNQILSAIANGQAEVFDEVSGLGKKTAERIVLELKNKVEYLEGADSFEAVSINNDTVEALMTLGYSKQQARDALSKVSKEIVDSGEQLKEALKFLGGR